MTKKDAVELMFKKIALREKTHKQFNLTAAVFHLHHMLHKSSLFGTFEDLLDFMLWDVTQPHEPLPGWKYTPEETEHFVDVSLDVLLEYRAAQEKGDVIDLFGDTYMALASKDKARLGQFFTPMNVAMLSAFLTESKAEKETENILDPCCGSGRMLLAKHKLHPATVCVGSDLDLTCVKMTTLNFCLNKIRGCVYHMDGLTLDYKSDFYYSTIGSIDVGVGILECTKVRIEKEDSA